jgi:7,8-dihydropterin-6-yl-methyl-4-(beta-D-ribofuranosyl)aminobenzene 5'-phosphate synthase
VYGIIGGLHGFDRYALFDGLQLICPTHCTQHKAEIKQRFGDRVIEVGVGKVIEV